MNLKTPFSKKTMIKAGQVLINTDSPKVMGILNVTPDSFYDGGKYNDEKTILDRVSKMISEGVDIIDIGACSTRPGAEEVSFLEEKKRLESVLNTIRNKYSNLVISIDTYRSGIAKWAVEEYAVNMINDISAGELDNEMFDMMASLQVPYVIMHMKGNPKTMQNNPEYEDIIKEVLDYFVTKINRLKEIGLHDIIIDPGFGFGKTIDHNYELLSSLDKLNVFGVPLLVGVSRKSMIYKVLGIDPEQALNGTTIINTMALDRGANILRVHDVKAAKEAILLWNKMQSFN